MADSAAYLVDRVMPSSAGYRQWTLSFPRQLRFRLLRDRSLTSELLGMFVRIVFAFHRRRARRAGIVGHGGAITAIQRFGSFLNGNVHFHTIIADGVFADQPDGSVVFEPLPPPSDAEVQALTERIVRRTARVVSRIDRDPAADAEPPEPLLEAQAESVQGLLAITADRESSSAGPRPAKRLCASLAGFSLHAATEVDACDRDALERLLRYILRPAISAQRVWVRDDGRVEYRFRKPDPTGRTSWVTDGVEFCRRLATLVPPARSHGLRFHGVFGSAHRLRARVIPSPASLADTNDNDAALTPLVRGRRLDWASLLQRVFGDDVTECPACGDRLRVLAFITDLDVTTRILDHLGLASAPIPIAPARAPPQETFADDSPYDPFDIP